MKMVIMYTIILIILAVGLYFLPTIIAFSNNKKNSVMVSALNLFLGFTVIGWIIALVLALASSEEALWECSKCKTKLYGHEKHCPECGIEINYNNSDEKKKTKK